MFRAPRHGDREDGSADRQAGSQTDAAAAAGTAQADVANEGAGPASVSGAGSGSEPASSDRTAPADGASAAGAGASADARATGRRGLSRRAAFTTAGLGAAAAGIAGFGAGRLTASEEPASTELSYPFGGEHQAGILTPAQDTLYIAAFDVSTEDPDELRSLLEKWTTAAEQMSAGELVGGEPDANDQLPPKDTGEAWGYPVSGLTITFGLGKSLFVDDDGQDRFGLADRMPAVLKDGVPTFKGDQLESASSDGDLVIQVCSDDAQVSVHAIRNLTRIAFGTATMRWSQIGYGRTSSTSTDQETPRNLFGFKDGTNNIKSQDSADQLDEYLWVQDGDDDAASWMTGGTYMVARKIHMASEIWDRVRLIEQEQIFGRDKRYGAPLSVSDPSATRAEFTPVDYSATGDDGQPLVPTDSHIAVVAPERNHGQRMLRRGYNFTEGNDSLGRLQSGLFFIAFVRDPRSGFYTILDRMTQSDALQEYLQHRASALFAVPAGVGTSDTTWAQALFA